MFCCRRLLWNRSLVGACFAVTMLVLAGCHGGSGLVPVKGKVMVGDKPVNNGYVIYYPDVAKGNTSMEEPRGAIDAEGNFELLSNGVDRGVTPGWYKIAVTAAEKLDPNNPYFTKWLIPEKYIDPKTSKLAVEVVVEPVPRAYDLVLEPKAPE